jgi:hypothetical protein
MIHFLGFRNGYPIYTDQKWEGLETEYNKDIGEYEFELKNGIPDGLGTFTRSDGEKCYENWKDGKKCNSELHTDLPESLSAKLTLKEFEETWINMPDMFDSKENTEESARKVQEELDKHDDDFPTDQT